MAPEANDVMEPEEVDETTALTLRHPGEAITLDQLAAMRGKAIEVIDARIQVLETARQRAVRMTHPEDWVLFKTPDERITGYLSDAGCERVRPITGIRIFDVEEPEKVVSTDGQSFAIIIRGRGRCELTREEIETVEGIRESTEDFCKSLKGIKQELRVRQAARANLDGKIVRELAGLGSVPIEELTRAWEGTNKKSEHCRKGRGFGTQDERHGGTRVGEPTVEPPTCPHCKPVNGAPVKLKYRPGKDGRAPFYGCPNYDKHPNAKVIVDVEKWVAEQNAKTATAAAAPVTTDREPGAEG